MIPFNLCSQWLVHLLNTALSLYHFCRYFILFSRKWMYNDINDQIIVKSIFFYISLGVRITIHVLVDTHAQSWQKKWASSHIPHSLITWKHFSYWMAWYTLNTNNNLIKSITRKTSWSRIKKILQICTVTSQNFQKNDRIPFFSYYTPRSITIVSYIPTKFTQNPCSG